MTRARTTTRGWQPTAEAAGDSRPGVYTQRAARCVYTALSRVYTVRRVKRQRTYRIDEELFDRAAAKAAAAGETVTDVITRAFRAYVADAPVLPSPGEIGVKVSTAREAAELGRALAAQRRPAPRPRGTRRATDVEAGLTTAEQQALSSDQGLPVPGRRRRAAGDGCRHPVNRRLGNICGACGGPVSKGARVAR